MTLHKDQLLMRIKEEFITPPPYSEMCGEGWVGVGWWCWVEGTGDGGGDGYFDLFSPYGMQ